MDDRSTFGQIRIATLVFGILFMVLGLAVLGGADADPAWIWIALLVAAGIGGIAATLRMQFSDRSDSR